MRVKTVTIATYNQNCLRAGEICRDEDMIDTVIEESGGEGGCYGDITVEVGTVAELMDSAAATTLIEVHDSNQMFRWKRARNIIEELEAV